MPTRRRRGTDAGEAATPTISTLSTTPTPPPPAGDTNSRLIVAVRIRPLSAAEQQQPKAFQCVHTIDDRRLLLLDSEKLENNVLRQNRQFERQFTFDSAFGPDSTHDQVHQQITAPLVDYVVAGYNATVFAYGPTGTGKTYTMVGTRQTPGLMTLMMRTLYERIAADDAFTVFISLMEIYNEVIRDLLNPSAGVLDLLEDESGNVQVPGLSRVRAPNTDRMMQILQEGNQRRTQEPTAANQSSSRSHALLQVTLYRNSHQHGKLFLIDLAGSERASQTQNRGQRLKEGAAINRSLLALGNVINALSAGGRGRYVNYRDSKLTRLLKDSLGGTSKTCMIAHVAPASTQYDETYNTLIYANRAKNISNQLARGRRPSSADNRRAASIVDEIRREIRRDSDGLAAIHHAASASQLTSGSDWDALRETPPMASMAVLSGRRYWVPQPLNGAGYRRFATLFNTLKEQYLACCEKLQRLRERLLKANYDAFEADLSRVSKAAILDAWEKRASAPAPAGGGDDDDEKYSRVIERIRRDSNEQERRVSQLQEARQKLERALRHGGETLRALERRMRSLARDPHQQELVGLLVRMAVRDAESMAATSDSVLQGVRMRWQENSLLRLRKYEQIADRLITSDRLSQRDRETLEAEYRVVRNQLNYHLIPLRRSNAALGVVSWNTQLLRDCLEGAGRAAPPRRGLPVGPAGSDHDDGRQPFADALRRMSRTQQRFGGRATARLGTESDSNLDQFYQRSRYEHVTSGPAVPSPSTDSDSTGCSERRASDATVVLSPVASASEDAASGGSGNEAGSEGSLTRAGPAAGIVVLPPLLGRLPTIRTQAPTTSSESASLSSPSSFSSFSRKKGQK